MNGENDAALPAQAAPEFSGMADTFIQVPQGSDFPLANLPWGVFSHRNSAARICVAVGEHVVDLNALAEAGLLAGKELAGPAAHVALTSVGFLHSSLALCLASCSGSDLLPWLFCC